MTTTNIPAIDWQLIKLGFTPKGTEYHRCGLSARLESRWLTFRSEATVEGDPIKGGPTSPAACVPGLWKHVHSLRGPLVRVFDLPLTANTDQGDSDDGEDDTLGPLREMIDWVSATKSGRLPAKWRLPPREELADTLPRNALTVETGRFARQGEFFCEGRRLAVSIPLLQRVPADLSTQRRACLDKLLIDVHNRSRVVRLIEMETGEQARSILAEVDLSGAPRFAIPLLLRIGLDALRHVVSQSISVVELLVDPAVTSAAWEIPSVQECPAERSQK